jgi:cardiolipin synthase
MDKDSKFIVISDPIKIYDYMLDDIKAAKSEILIEVYKFNSDEIGTRFRDVLVEKAKEGVKVKVLADSFGSTSTNLFFNPLVKAGGEVRFFKKIKIFLDSFTKNHRRNHRKIITIDREILYTGSANITSHCLTWRELMLRAKHPIVNDYVQIFHNDFNAYNKYTYSSKKYLKSIYRQGFIIIRDKPSTRLQRVMRQYVKMINDATKSVVIETPYFLPGGQLRRAMINAARKGVKVKIVLPLHSDVGAADLLRSRYIGILHEEGVEILFYKSNNLHSKLLLIDDRLFSVGSPNFDYRSFLYQHEIALIGNDNELVEGVLKHSVETLKNCVPFNYESWKARPVFQRILEYLLRPFRYLM